MLVGLGEIFPYNSRFRSSRDVGPAAFGSTNCCKDLTLDEIVSGSREHATNHAWLIEIAVDFQVVKLMASVESFTGGELSHSISLGILCQDVNAMKSDATFS